MKNSSLPRRHFIKSSAFGLVGISAFGAVPAMANNPRFPVSNGEPLFYRYPGMSDEMVSTIVGASHRDFDKVKEMVSRRPELANAAWDWGFGDWETPIGAASHVGRKDIAELLMQHGARPDIFTFTMLGMVESVRGIIESVPGIQRRHGPHGITLLQHARNRLTGNNISEADKANVNEVIRYLESLGDADIKQTSLGMSEEEKNRYTGEFRFGAGESEIFVVNLNSRKLLQITRKGGFGRILHKVEDHTFSPAGSPSVRIIFRMNGDKASSFSIHEPEPLVNAARTA